MVFNNLENGRVHERMHVAMMYTENCVLELLIVFQINNFQAHSLAFVDVNMTVMSFSPSEIRKLMNDVA